jgi:hypothetical protein
MTDIDQLIQSTQTVLKNIRKQPPCDVIKARFLGMGIVNVGIMISDTQYWPVGEFQIVNNMITPEAGAVVRTKTFRTEGTFRYVKNSFYDNRNI